MTASHYYLTVATEKREPQRDGYIAVISRGHFRLGDPETLLCSVEVVPNMKAAKRWFREQVKTEPWERRN